MREKIGILTIGQSPRTDMTPEMRAYLPEHIGVVEMGALDGLSETVRKPLEPGEEDITLVSRLHNGRSVKVSEEAILPLLQEKIRALEAAGTKTTILACTGSFPPFDSRYPLLYPDAYYTISSQGYFPKANWVSLYRYRNKSIKLDTNGKKPASTWLLQPRLLMMRKPILRRPLRF